MWKYQKEVLIPYMDNIYYENNSEKLLELRKIPTIIDAEKTIELIIKDHKSLSRFGDGEFEMMLFRDRPKFQLVDNRLSNRLKEIIRTNLANHILAIADNYGDLSKYTDDAANGIRKYLKPTVRMDHMKYLDMHRSYYDAYLSRPYIMYRNKDYEYVKQKFDLIKSIWEKQNLLVIEGKHTRFGVGNDLLLNAQDVKRIIVPDKNAFSAYDCILKKARVYAKDRLVLAIIGPTATVLAYDLAKEGYWAIDIGQVDTEYEWFLKGTEDRCNIKCKTVSEYTDKKVISDIEESYKKIYTEQIVEIIE